MQESYCRACRHRRAAAGDKRPPSPVGRAPDCGAEGGGFEPHPQRFFRAPIFFRGTVAALRRICAGPAGPVFVGNIRTERCPFCFFYNLCVSFPGSWGFGKRICGGCMLSCFAKFFSWARREYAIGHRKIFAGVWLRSVGAPDPWVRSPLDLIK